MDHSTISIGETVKDSWNKIGGVYAANRNVRKMDRELHRFKGLLPAYGKVLDVGSGAGIPVSQFLVKNGFKVTGIDISDTMLKLARENIPEATFIKMNMLKIDLLANFFDGLVCVFSIFHIPRQYHEVIFSNFNRVLKPGGVLLLNTGIHETEGFSQFFDVPMYWSSYQPSRTSMLVKKANFDLISDQVLSRGGESQYWIFARKSE